MRTRLRVALVIVATAALMFSAAPVAHAEVSRGTLEGTVVDEKGLPRSGVHITVSAGSAGTILLSTDLDGTFRTDAIVGDYLLYFYAADFSAIDMYGGYSEPQTVHVVAGQTVTIDEVLRTGGIVSGRVLDIHGKPIAGAQVSAADPGLYRTELYGSDRGATTDAKGRYTLTGLVTGAFRIRISKPGYFAEWYGNSPTESGAKPVSTSEGHTTTGLASHLSKGGTISGRVLINGKKPKSIPGAHVSVKLLSGDGKRFISNMSARKRFSFETEAAGRYIVEYCAGPAIDGKTCTRKSVTVKRGHSVTGLVVELSVPSLRR